jgi:hypothetical protein
MVRVVALPAVAFLGWYAIWGPGDTRMLLSREEALRIPESAATLLGAPSTTSRAGGARGLRR